MASKLPLLALLIAVTCLSQFYRVSNSGIAPDLVRTASQRPQLELGRQRLSSSPVRRAAPVGLWFDRFGARRTVSVCR